VPYRPPGERAGEVLAAELAGAPLHAWEELPAALSVRRSTAPPPGTDG
jgi:hypothetical protein